MPRQDLADAPMLAEFLDAELRLGLETALEDQIVNGDGVGENFTGLATVSGTQAQAWDEVVWRCEMRAGFDVKRPAGMVQVDLTAV